MSRIPLPSQASWIQYDDWRKLAAQAVNVYGSVCHLCGQPINLTLTGTRDPMRLSLDHLIPRSRGGTNSIENLRPAHFRCNSARGARPIAPHAKRERDARFF